MTIENERKTREWVLGGAAIILLSITSMLLGRAVNNQDQFNERQMEFNEQFRQEVQEHEWRIQDLEKHRKYYYDRNREDKE